MFHAMRRRMRGGSVYVMKIEHIIKKMGGVVDEESCDEEEIWNDDEVIDAVGIVGGSEEEIGVEEEL